MYYGKIDKVDIANGSGVRVSLFVSGCDLRCKGCFNPETWNFKYGRKFTNDTVIEILKAMAPDYITGLTVLGGEPLHEKNYAEVSLLCHLVKKYYPDKTIWIYTGKSFEDVRHLRILKNVDVLVDGSFIEEEKDITLKFRGSRNQRIIDVQESFRVGTLKLL